MNEPVKKALRAVWSGKAKVDVETERSIYFNIGSHQVRYDKTKDMWICDCVYEVFRTDPELFCSHILTAKILRERAKGRNGGADSHQTPPSPELPET